MKKNVKILSFVVAFLMLFTTTTSYFSAASYPFDYKAGEWDSYWEKVNGDNTQITLNVGADDTEMNFVWHRAKTSEKPIVRISSNKNMTNYDEFIGENSRSENKDQIVSRVTATDLKADTIYYYICGSGNTWSDSTAFRTGISEKTRFLFVSDIQIDGKTEESTEYGARTWNAVLEYALEKNDNIEFFLAAGDMTNAGNSTNEWAATISPVAMRSLPFASVPGNHDNKGPYYRHYVNTPNNYKMLSTSVSGAKDYYFRNDDTLFIMIDTMNLNIFGHYNFLKKAISENTDAKWRVLSFHQDIYGAGSHAADAENPMLQVLLSSILHDFDFDIVLNGHEHLYSRSYFMKNNKIVSGIDNSASKVVDPDGTLYITANNASGRQRYYEDYPFTDINWVNFKYMTQETPLYSIIEFEDNNFTLNTYRSDNNEKVDTIQIEKTSDNKFAEIDLDKNVLQTGVIFKLLMHFIGKLF